MKPITLGITAIAALALLTGCARNLSNNVYSSNATVGKVVYGTVVSARPVTIKDADRLGNNGAGVLAGGAAGAAIGSGAGSGSGKTASTVGGAIAGALIGAVIQDQLGTQSGMEYIVRLEGERNSSKNTPRSRVDTKTNAQASADINRSIQLPEMQTETISVIQDDSVIFSAGQRVMVIYNDDRARLQAIQ